MGFTELSGLNSLMGLKGLFSRGHGVLPLWESLSPGHDVEGVDLRLITAV